MWGNNYKEGVFFMTSSDSTEDSKLEYQTSGHECNSVYSPAIHFSKIVAKLGFLTPCKQLDSKIHHFWMAKSCFC
jgi:hypothetical protein